MRKGIMCVGTTVLDTVKQIDRFPEKNHVSIIQQVNKYVGGNVPNVLIDLAILDPNLNLEAVAIVGDDSSGEFILNELQKHHINTKFVKKKPFENTSLSDVMTLSETGERTVFYYKGASALLSVEDIFFVKTNCKIVQIAYLGALDALEEFDDEHTCKIVKALDHFSQQGCETTIDVISINFDDKLKKTLIQCLPYTDYLIANEIESSLLHNIPLRDREGKLIMDNFKKSLEKYMNLGVRKCAVIHCPEIGVCLDKNGKYLEIESYFLPPNKIKGAVGAGDAFCAGFLYAMHENLDTESALKYGHVMARYNLKNESAIGGAVSLQVIKNFISHH